MKFCKKPQVFDAVQWLKMGDHPLVIDYHHAYDLGYRHPDPNSIGLATIDNPDGKGLIKTNGWLEVSKNDWIVIDSTGEISVFDPELFQATFELIGG